MRVRSGRAFEPRRRPALPLHAKLTRELGVKAPLSFEPWTRRSRATTEWTVLRLKTQTKRRSELLVPLAAMPVTAPSAALAESNAPESERGALDRDSVLPLELLAHASVPAPPPEPKQRKTPKPPRPQRVVLETDDDLSSIAPPALFAVTPSDAPLVASTPPLSSAARASRAASRLASIALFGGLGVIAGWTLRGHSEQDQAVQAETRTPPLTAALAALPPVVRTTAPVPREIPSPAPSPAPADPETPELTPETTTRIEVPVVNVIARSNAESAEAEDETNASPAHGAADQTERADLPEFDAEAARQSIALAEERLSVCRGPSDPTGPATVVVRYAPSGRVTTATVESGPFAGTPAGGCIAATFRSTRVPPFAGDPVTVKRTVTLR